MKPHRPGHLTVHPYQVDNVSMAAYSTQNEDGLTVIPDGAHAGEELSHIRSRLSGYHFAKEAMDPQAVQVLLLAEALLAVLDAEDPQGYRR